MTIKIAHLNLAKGLRGGENQTLAIIKGLDDFDIQQTLICRRNSELEEKAISNNINTIGIDKPFIFRLNKLKDFNLLHVHEGRSIYMALAANLIYGLRYLVTRRIPNKPHDKIITKMAYNKASSIVSLSNAVNTVMQKFCKNPEFHIIPSIARTIDYDNKTLQELKEKYKNKFIIGHIGALNDHHKNQTLIIKTAQLMSKEEDIIFLLLGTGKDEHILKSLVSSLNLKNIVFEGYKSNIGDYYALFDIFIYPSKEEGLGSAILEAFHFKNPVIGANVDGIPDIIGNNEYGLLIDPFDDNELANAIMRLYQDENLRKYYQAAGYQRKDFFSSSKVCHDYMNIYQKILGSSI